MYMGHMGLALAARGAQRAASAQPAVPLWACIAAAYALDLGRYALLVAGLPNPGGVLTNSLPAALVIAAAVGVVYQRVWQSRRGAAAAALVTLLHWPADFVTNRVPLWPLPGHAGLRLFTEARWDLTVEAAVIGAGWLLYCESLPAGRRRSWAAWIMLAALLAFQVYFLSEN